MYINISKQKYSGKYIAKKIEMAMKLVSKRERDMYRRHGILRYHNCIVSHHMSCILCNVHHCAFELTKSISHNWMQLLESFSFTKKEDEDSVYDDNEVNNFACERELSEIV